jgi:hypothetical protein
MGEGNDYQNRWLIGKGRLCQLWQSVYGGGGWGVAFTTLRGKSIGEGRGRGYPVLPRLIRDRKAFFVAPDKSKDPISPLISKLEIFLVHIHMHTYLHIYLHTYTIHVCVCVYASKLKFV